MTSRISSRPVVRPRRNPRIAPLPSGTVLPGRSSSNDSIGDQLGQLAPFASNPKTSPTLARDCAVTLTCRRRMMTLPPWIGACLHAMKEDIGLGTLHDGRREGPVTKVMHGERPVPA